MRLTELRVRNYRNIGAEQTLRFANGVTLVGPNNSGKTNLLRSVQLFFTGYDNSLGYRRSEDLTFGAGSQQTSLIATFDFDDHPRDAEVIDLLDELHQIVGTTRDADQFTVNLYFTGVNDTPVYRVFGNVKVPNPADRPTFSRKQKQLVETLMRTFRIYCVPSAKSISDLYDDLLEPFVTQAAMVAIVPHLQGVKDTLIEVSKSLNEELASAGLPNLEASFHLDVQNPAGMFAGIKLLLSDPSQTPIFDKGQGIQSTALFASFVWISEQERSAHTIPVWLIEEPESYLHPELSKACHELLRHLGEESTVLLTTHALAFVPNDVDRIQGVELDTSRRTIVSAFNSHQQATRRIRDSLGVQFADYYNLGLTNVFVEGPSDEELIRWSSALLSNLDGAISFPLIDSSLIENFGGVSQLEGFLRGVFQPLRTERAIVAVMDGDAAGVKSRQNLQQFFSNIDVQFQPNREFVSVRAGLAIEGLFPDDWIVEMHDQHPGWFQNFSLDASGALEPFRLKDQNKAAAQRFLTGKAEGESDVTWAGRCIDLLTAIEESLSRQKTDLSL